jgi:hypothetical protein
MPIYLDPAILSFYISLAGILGMLGLKVAEIRSNKKTLISKIAEKTDDTVWKYYINTKKILSYINRKSAIALIQWIAYYILSWARRAYIWAHRKAHAHPPSKKVIDMVRGRGEIKKNGGVSFFLKSISSEDVGEEGKK